MFQVPALISLLSDVSVVILYFARPSVVGDSHAHSWGELFDLYNSFLLFVILAGVRIILMLLEVYQFRKNKRMIKVYTLYSFLLFNTITVVIKISVIATEISICQAFVVGFSLLSIFCQVICLSHLKSSVLPVRHVVLGLSLRPLRLHHGLPQHEQNLDSIKTISDLSHLIDENKESNVEYGHFCPKTAIYNDLDKNMSGGSYQGEYYRHMRISSDDDEKRSSLNHLRITRNIWQAKIDGIKSLVRKMRGKYSTNINTGYETIGSDNNRIDGSLIDKNNNSMATPMTLSASSNFSSHHHEDVFDLILYLFVGETHADKAIDRLEQLFSQYPQEVEFYLPQLTVYLLYGSFGTRGLQLKRAMLNMCTLSLPFALKLHWFVASFCLAEAGVQGESLRTLMALTAEIETAGEVAALALVDNLQQQQQQQQQQRDSNSIENNSVGTSKCTVCEKPKVNNVIADTMTTPIKSVSLPQCYPVSVLRAPVMASDTHYSLSIKFWHEMVTISRILGATARPVRQQALRRLIREKCGDYLPSATIHVPFRNTKHRVWAIHAEECFAFSSVDRAPVLLCLEVHTFGTINKREEESKHWWLPRLSARKHSLTPKSTAIDTTPSSSSYRYNANGYRELVSWDSHDDVGSSPIRRITQQKLQPKTPAFYQSSYDNAHDTMKLRCSSHDIGQWQSPGQSEMMTAATRGKWTSSSSLPTARTPIRKSVPLVPQQSEFGSVNNAVRKSVPLITTTAATTTTASNTSSTNGRALRSNLSKELEQEAAVVAMPPDNSNNLSNDAEQGIMSEIFMNNIENSCDGRCVPPTAAIRSASNGMSDIASNKSMLDESGDNGDHDHDHDGHPDRTATESEMTSSSVVFKEQWCAKEQRIRQSSPIGHLEGWRLVPVIVKSNDDLRQEQCAAQMIQLMHDILQSSHRVKSGLRPYEILAMSPDSGLIEAIPDTVSLHALRSKEFGYTSLLDFFEQYFGGQDTHAFHRAQDNFIKSLADYSIACYLLQIKDRHNGNMLLTTQGHIVHIDFGFLLGKTPGDVGFEKAPFKLTKDFVEVMGGQHSKTFHKFRRLCVQSFLQLRKHHYRIILLLEMISKGSEHLRCFSGDSKRVIDEMRHRFCPDMHDNAVVEVVHGLIDDSLDNWTTTWYDRYQKCFVGVF